MTKGKSATTPDRKGSKILGLNLGPKTTAEMATIGIHTAAELKAEGWESAFKKLVKKYPHRLNLNMASALIGATLGKDWREIPEAKKAQAKALIKELKPRKPRPASSPRPKQDTSFVEYIIHDQLDSLHVEARRMFGSFGLYCKGRFFGIIHDGCVYLKTDDKTRNPYIKAGMKPFTPNPRQTLKSLYQVPIDILEDADEFHRWAVASISLR
jgi:DNA transformation protein and related proteins